MSEDRNNPDFVAESDPLVTRAYREVADERVPDKLNQAVLRQAAAAGSTRYWRSRSWTRPMAWVATITICVALVLELTRVPPANGPAIDSLPATPTEPAKTELMKRSARPLAAEPVSQERKRDSAMQAPLESRMAAAQDREAPACDEDATATPETWLECIDELEKAGLADAARRQRALLAKAFPDFDSR